MNETKEWTLMFYFASDNPLAASVVSQLKAIKNAGFHSEANVIAQFDPNTVGTPTHIFDVNRINKLKQPGGPNVGFSGNDPFIRNLIEDKLWADQKARDGASSIKDEIKKALWEKHRIDYDPPLLSTDDPEEPNPERSLGDFLEFCSKNYPARHYVLVILGHGMVVGNDIFLFDEHAEEHSLSLKQLSKVLTTFKKETERQDAQFELVGFHSCSVSSLEVAYELQGTANYMLASQGPAFVGSWPYRQILIRVFNDLVDDGDQIDVKEMLVKIFFYCLYNSWDFLLAGYSYDLALCDLNKVSGMKEPLEELSEALIGGLADPLATELILLSHWKSQSYWQETYTDLYDFCLCLSKGCMDPKNPEAPLSATLQAINAAADKVMNQLAKGVEKDDDKFIVRAEFAGPAYQYSHGLSVFFPWSQPSDDSNVLKQYQQYRFHEDFKSSWLTFLKEYFRATMRHSRNSKSELDGQPVRRLSEEDRLEEELQEDIASLIYNGEGSLSEDNSLGPRKPLARKVNPLDGTGEDCACGSIKNHPHDTRPRSEREEQAGDKKLLSDDFFEKFR